MGHTRTKNLTLILAYDSLYLKKFSSSRRITPSSVTIAPIQSSVMSSDSSDDVSGGLLGPRGYAHVLHVHDGRGGYGRTVFRTYQNERLDVVRSRWSDRLSGLRGQRFVVFLYDINVMDKNTRELHPRIKYSDFVKNGVREKRAMSTVRELSNCGCRCMYNHEGHVAFHWIAYMP